MDGALLFQLDRDRLCVSGADAADFLHRLTTLEVRALAVGSGGQPFLLSGTGRICCVGNLLRVEPDRFLLDCAASHAADWRRELDRLHFGEALAIEPVEGSALLALQGVGAAGLLQGCLPAEAEWSHRVGTLGGVAVRAVRLDRSGLGGFDVWCSRRDEPAVIEALLAAGASSAALDRLESLRVVAGLPAWGHEYSPASSPLEVSGRRGISEGKGCYPGQEVIERTLSLGRPARVLVRLRLSDPVAPPACLEHEGREVGRLTSLARLPGGEGWAGLGLVRRGALTASTLTCAGVGATIV